MSRLFWILVFLMGCKEHVNKPTIGKVFNPKDDCVTNIKNGLEDTFSINNRLFKLYSKDSNWYIKVDYWDSNKWINNIDSIYLFHFFAFDIDRSFDGFKDLNIYYNRGFCSYLYNPQKRLFEPEAIGFSNSYEVLDSANLIFYNGPVSPYDSWNYDLYSIKNYTKSFLYNLQTSYEKDSDGKYEHSLFEYTNNNKDSMVLIKSFYDSNDHMSFDYEKFWKKIMISK